MAKHTNSQAAMMATSQFYRVLLERTFKRDGNDDVMIPKTTVMLTGKEWSEQQKGWSSERLDA